MKYLVNETECFPECVFHEIPHLQDGLFQELESEYIDLSILDLVCINGTIQVDLEKYHASRLSVEVEQLRATRNALLKAFDVYKSNVNYGVEIETQEQHEEMRVWYLAILELDTYAIDNPPLKISYYLGV